MSKKEIDPNLPFDTKQDARDSRLKLRKTNEEVIRRNLKTLATDKCVDYFRDFGKCASEQGLMVVFNCRAQNKAMSDCMDTHYNDDIVQQYLEAKGLTMKKNPTIFESAMKLFK